MLANRLLVFLFALNCVLSISPIPGLDSIGVGFDVVHGKSRLPVVSWTYNAKNSWTNPFTSQKHDAPDQVIVSVSSEADLTANVFWTVKEYVASMVDFAGIANGGGIPSSAFGFSAEVIRASTVLAGGEYAFVVTENQFVLYEIASFPSSSLQLSEPFSSFVNSLPETYDAASYKRLLETFGTHVVVQVAVGGKAVMFTQLEAVAAAEIGAQAVVQLAVSQFNNFTQFGIAGRGAVAAEFEATVDLFSYFSFKGGIFEEVDNYNGWVKSIKLAPIPVKYQLTEITELISHPIRKENVRTALMEHNNIKSKGSIHKL